MINLVRELVSFLSRDALGTDDVVARIGSVAYDPGVPMPIELSPTVAGVRSANLSRYPKSGLPYVLTLQLAADTRLTPAALRSVLGDYHRGITDRGMPPEVLFSPQSEGARWRVVVLVQLESATGGLETALITNIAFRRDPITP